MNHINYLISLDACQSDIDMAAKFPSLSEAWEACENPQYMLRLLRAAGAIVRAQVVDIAVQCSERALPHWEMKHPNDDTARAAIDAAKAWLKEPTEENRLAAKQAAESTHAGLAYVAQAVNSTIPCSPVVCAVVNAATQATDYVAELKAQADIIRSVVGNPFKDI